MKCHRFLPRAARDALRQSAVHPVICVRPPCIILLLCNPCSHSSPFPPSPRTVAGPTFSSYDSHGAVEVVQRLSESGVYARVLGNIAYVMVSPTTPPEACGDLMATVASVIRGLGEDSGSSSWPDPVAYSI